VPVVTISDSDWKTVVYRICCYEPAGKDWTLATDNGDSITAAYIDFAKAFDSVSHQKLLPVDILL